MSRHSRPLYPSRHTPTAPRLFRWLMPGLALVATNAAYGIEGLHMSLGTIEGAGWKAQHVTVDAAFTPEGSVRFDLHAKHLELPAPLGEQSNVTVSCAAARLGPEVIHCPRGSVLLKLPGLKRQPLSGEFRYHPAERTVDVRMPNVDVNGNAVTVTARSNKKGWRLTFQGNDLDAAKLPAPLSAFGVWPEGYKAQGRVKVDGRVVAHGKRPPRIELQVHASNAGFLSPDSLNAAENLEIQAQMTLTRADGYWTANTRLAASNGVVCFNWCWTLTPEPLQADGQVRWFPDIRRLEVEQLHLQHPDIPQARARLEVDILKTISLEALSLKLEPTELKALYERWLQPALIGTAYGQLQLEGRIAGTLRYRRNGLASVALTLDRVALARKQGTFSITGLQGVVNWDNTDQALPVRLRWRAGKLYRFTLGAGQARFRTGPRSVELSQPASFPILDGQLEAEQLGVRWTDKGALQWRFNGILTPISMTELTKALQWPTMQGKLSGVIPAIEYEADTLTVDGVLLVRVFDGQVTLRDLQLQRPFGRVPEMRANIELRNLDLEQLTGTFAFGNIRGRLEGYINGLILQNWKPVAFDAALRTPEDDASRHRISQKAVDNLTRLGGGVGGAVSRGFLSMFEQFSYDRLGLRCRLREGVCQMGGVEPAENGYYIVKGGGLPRINVIGYQTRVDWSVLVQRLKTVTSGKGPVVR